MNRGKVCEKHQEFSPDGVCRWCPTPPSEAFLALAEKLEVVDFTAGGGPLQIVYGPLQQQRSPLPAWPLPDPNIGPLPVASCKHDGVLYDYGGTTSCAACGKVLKAPAPLLCVRWQVPPCTNAVAWVWTATVHDPGMTFPACEEHHAEWLRQNASILHNWTREKLQ